MKLQFKNIQNLEVNSQKAEKAAQMTDTAGKSGKFFTVKFVKKDGSIREMNCRLGVTKHLAGGKKTLTDNYICVYDVKSEGYRAIDPEKVLTVNNQNVEEI